MSFHFYASQFATTIRQQWTGDIVQNLATGESFTAEISPVLDMELNEALGRDAREQETLKTLNRVQGLKINLNDVLLSNGQKFRVVRRTDNPLDPQIEFGLAKILAKDQT